MKKQGKTKTSLGSEKQTRDLAGFPLAKLRKPVQFLLYLLSGKRREPPSFCFFSCERSSPCPGFYFCICSGSVNPILTAEGGDTFCSSFLHLGKAVGTLPVARGKEIGVNTSFRIEFTSSHHNTSGASCVFSIKYWHGCAVAMWFWWQYYLDKILLVFYSNC